MSSSQDEPWWPPKNTKKSSDDGVLPHGDKPGSSGQRAVVGVVGPRLGGGFAYVDGRADEGPALGLDDTKIFVLLLEE